MSNNIKRFIYNTLVDRTNICNLVKEADKLVAALQTSDKIVIYGKRDSGKTSLIKNVVIPDGLERTPGGMAIYVELYGVKSIEDVAEKLTIYFNKTYQATFTLKATLKSTARILKGIRPSFSISPDGSMEASLKGEWGGPQPKVESFFEAMVKLHKNGIRVALILDEFQDIAFADGAEALLREEMQKLSFDIPVIILGSKQHLLAKIFQKPKAPFFNWGKRLEIKALPIDEYSAYILERFGEHAIAADSETLSHLQKMLLFNPEAINMFCSHIVYQIGDRKTEGATLTISTMEELLKEYIASLGGEFETYLDSYTKNEVRVLTLIAKQGILTNPLGKDALGRLRLSASGMRKIIDKLLDHADIYREESGLVLSKPLLMHYLREWRLLNLS